MCHRLLLAQLCRPNMFQMLDSSYLDREIVIEINVLLNNLPKSTVEIFDWSIQVGLWLWPRPRVFDNSSRNKDMLYVSSMNLTVTIFFTMNDEMYCLNVPWKWLK